MRVMAWLALTLGVAGLLVAPLPVFIALVAPEDSGWMQAGWALMFVTVPVGLLLLGASVILTITVGIRGLLRGPVRLASSLALIGAVGCAVMLALLVSLMVVGTDSSAELALGLVGASTVLFIVGIVAGFFASRSTTSTADLAINEITT